MREVLTYSQKIIKEHAEEEPSYFLCGRKDVRSLTEKAKKDAENLLREFAAFFKGDIGITIGVKEHFLGWSITATLTVNGEEVKTEDPCDLLFLELNELMLERMTKLGIPSRAAKYAET